jgi:hypothetical protein
MKYIVSIFFICLLSIDTPAQDNPNSIQRARLIPNGRYESIAGSPYYFPVWVRGKILRSDGTTVESMLLNYNGYSHQLEVRTEDGLYALDKFWYLRGVVLQEQNVESDGIFSTPELIFQFSAHEDLADRYSIILFVGSQLSLIKDFDVRKADAGVNSPGKYLVGKEFTTLSTYYLKKSGMLIPLTMQKRRMIDAFGDARMTEYILKRKPDLKSERELVALVKYADALD